VRGGANVCGRSAALATVRPILVAALFLTCLLTALPALAAAPCPPGNADYPPFYQSAGLFDGAIAKVADYPPSNEKLTGITVPHHLLADRLVALGFQAASDFSYRRIVILTPDHFRKTDKPFATTARGFETVEGPVGTDGAAVARLLQAGDWIEESCLFDKDHGIRAMLPFVRHYFPNTPIVPVAVSIHAAREDWDRMADALAPLLDRDTLVVESTDFSHYLPQHEARRFDQQTLNVLASGSLDGIAALQQPSHADSVGLLYIQTKLQKALFGAGPLVIANENSQQYASAYAASTTSYQVILFGGFGPGYNDPPLAGTHTYYFAGDVNFGRSMKKALLDPDVADRVAGEILARTKSRPLIVNLEGVILPNVPEAIDDMTLAMPEDLATAWLKRLHVAGAGLANNHAMDLGASGYAETTAALDKAGIAWFGQGDALRLLDIDVVGLTDIDTNGSQHVDLLTPALLDRLVRPDAERPVVAFVHWGREYVAHPSDREKALADEMRLRSVSAIIGGHPHVASDGVTALAGGDVGEVYSLGNFLFDQTAARASGQMVELRVFGQGTVFMRTIPLPNFFDMARGKND
jgi:poly-gamma-glutamate synthesis protein (capsule biosynthesis protein)